MIHNTTDTSALPATPLIRFNTTIATLQSRTLGLSSSITQTKNSIESFLATYQQQQASLLQGIDILAQQFDLTERNLRDSQTQANIGLDSATTAYETSLKSKETTLKALRSAIQQAQISYQEAQTQLEKLQVTSPIDGTISEILVDE
jgi:multidrug resistance efflux pump